MQPEYQSATRPAAVRPPLRRCPTMICHAMDFSRLASVTLDRRSAIIGGAALFLPGCRSAKTPVASDANGVAKLRALEREANGRLGAFVLDPVRGTAFGWRHDERFAHASSFKLSLAAMMLAGGDTGRIDLDEILHWTKDDMISSSPVTQVHLDRGLSVRDLARATLVTSDNTAANVLMRRFGGPARLTAFWRSIGDRTSRLDRYEPELNATPPGTQLDTTTPAAMATTVAALVHGTVLRESSRALLKACMTEVTTGQGRLRSGFPVGWTSGDKTGTGISETTRIYVDLAFGGPVGRAPLIVAGYFEPARRTDAIDPDAVAVLAQVGRIAAASLTGA